MSRQDDEFLMKLRSAFQSEAAEHLQAISSGLLELEKACDPERSKEIVSVVFREAHSLKGAARAVSLNEIESVCQSLESVFAAWRGREFDRSPELFDPLHRAVDAIEKLLPKTGIAHEAVATVSGMSDLLNQLASLAAYPDEEDRRADQERATVETPFAISQTDAFAAVITPEPIVEHPFKLTPETGARQAASPATPPGKVVPSDTLRISAAKLDALLLRTEELLAVKLIANQRPAELHGIRDMFEAWTKEWNKVAPELAAAKQLLEAAALDKKNNRTRTTSCSRLLEFVDWNQSHVRAIEARLAALTKVVDHDRRTTVSLIDALLEDSKKLLVLPFVTLLEMFPRLVRDLSREQRKDIDLVMRGKEVEIDKRILEEMKDPLIHLLRNCIDHGIEAPGERRRLNKPERGTVTIAVSQVESDKVEIVVSDDGGGIDPERVRAAALQRGMLTGGEDVPFQARDALNLIFQPEVSTSEIITEISGRGLGLAIVKEKVEKLGGRVMAESTIGSGTTFRLQLPVTLATFRGIFAQVAGQIFVVPTANVERVTRIRPDEIKTIENRASIRLNQRPVSLVRLADVLELPSTPKQDAAVLEPVMVLNHAETRIAFCVEAVLDEREVLVKRLAKPLVRVRNIAGATILASGRAVPILNVADLIKSAIALSGNAGAVASAQASVENNRKSILVVDDSMTARMLLKNILESAGHLVKTAVDGIDALTTLKTEVFDLVVSDVEMPRMDGFELTTRLRADKRLADVPVILVTALASPQDRERGVDAGADAYFVKSSFDQGSLLDAIQRLA